MATRKPNFSLKQSRPSLLPWLGIAAIVILFDQISKITITKLFVLGEEKLVTSFFNLVLAYNRGAAFSFLQTRTAGSATSSPPSASSPSASSCTCCAAMRASACSAGRSR